MTSRKVKEWLGRPPDGIDPIAILIDCIHVDEHVFLVVLGVDKEGKKHVLDGKWADQALRLGAGTEERRLDPDVKPQRLWLPRRSRGGLSVGCSGVVREQGAVLPRGSDQLGERLDHVPLHRGEDLCESAHPHVSVALEGDRVERPQ